MRTSRLLSLLNLALLSIPAVAAPSESATSGSRHTTCLGRSRPIHRRSNAARTSPTPLISRNAASGSRSITSLASVSQVHFQRNAQVEGVPHAVDHQLGHLLAFVREQRHVLAAPLGLDTARAIAPVVAELHPGNEQRKAEQPA